MEFLATILVNEEFNRLGPRIDTAVLSAKFGTKMILEYGDEWQKEQ